MVRVVEAQSEDASYEEILGELISACPMQRHAAALPEGGIPGGQVDESLRGAYEFMCYVHEVVADMAEALHFDKGHAWHRALVMLYSTMLELLGSACILIRAGVHVGVPILLRSSLEAYADFSNLSKQREYGYHMRAAELQEWIRVHRAADDPENPYLKGLSDAPGRDAILSQWESELAELKEKDFRPLQQKEKFEQAGLEQLYRSVYNSLCCDSHNNIRALVSRHIDISSDESDFEIELYATMRPERLLPYVATFCRCIVNATEIVHGCLGAECEGPLLGLKASYQRVFRDQIAGSDGNTSRG